MFLVIIYDYKINTQKTTGDSGFFMPVYRAAEEDWTELTDISAVRSTARLLS